SVPVFWRLAITGPFWALSRISTPVAAMPLVTTLPNTVGQLSPVRAEGHLNESTDMSVLIEAGAEPGGTGAVIVVGWVRGAHPDASRSTAPTASKNERVPVSCGVLTSLLPSG